MCAIVAHAAFIHSGGIFLFDGQLCNVVNVGKGAGRDVHIVEMLLHFFQHTQGVAGQLVLDILFESVSLTVVYILYLVIAVAREG